MSEPEPSKPPMDTTTSRSDIKFVIGFTAGFFAALMPRLSASVVSHSVENMEAISSQYLILACLFGLVVGALVTIFEWRIAKEPKATFLMALGIPSLFTGAANSLDTSAELTEQLRQNTELSKNVESMLNVPVTQTTLQPLDDAPDKTSWLMKLSPVSDAHAATAQQQVAENFSPSIRQNTVHAVVLERTNDVATAKKRAQELSARVGEVVAMKEGNDRYVLVLANTRMTRQEALLEVLRLRRDYGINGEMLVLK